MAQTPPHPDMWAALERAKRRIHDWAEQHPEAALAAEPYFQSELWEQFTRDPPAPLTPVEVRVITGVSHGLTNQMISEVFGMAPETVKSHMIHLRHKLKAKDRAHAACIAIRLGLIP